MLVVASYPVKLPIRTMMASYDAHNWMVSLPLVTTLIGNALSFAQTGIRSHCITQKPIRKLY
jgi:hypothetical protein